MLVRIVRHDCAEDLQEGRQPVALMTQDDSRSGCWHVADHPVPPDGTPVQWVTTHTDSQLVRIPLHPYLTKDREPQTLFAAGFQMGVLAIQQLPPQAVVDKVHILVGDAVVPEDGIPGYRIWLGVGIKVKR